MTLSCHNTCKQCYWTIVNSGCTSTGTIFKWNGHQSSSSHHYGRFVGPIFVGRYSGRCVAYALSWRTPEGRFFRKIPFNRCRSFLDTRRCSFSRIGNSTAGQNGKTQYAAIQSRYWWSKPGPHSPSKWYAFDMIEYKYQILFDSSSQLANFLLPYKFVCFLFFLYLKNLDFGYRFGVISMVKL